MRQISIGTSVIVVVLALAIISAPVLAQENSDTERRLELIRASQELVEEKQEADIKPHKLGSVFTTFGEGENVINTGLRVAPQVANFGGRPLRFMGEIFYLRGEGEIATFLSLTFEPISNIYLGAGGEVTGAANYHVFAGWDITENIFIEARAINTEESFEDSNVYPVAGFQMNF